MKQVSITNFFLENNSFLKDKYKFSLVGHNLGIDEHEYIVMKKVICLF